jgi:hypothetical protein
MIFRTIYIRLLAIVAMAMVINGPAAVTSAGVYTSTAHGNSTSGVDRSLVTGSSYPDSTDTYPTGSCGHCHEQHAAIGDQSLPASLPSAYYYALFADNYGSNTNNLCYTCHDLMSLSGMTLGYGRYGIYQGSTKYNNSIHYTSSNMTWSPDPSPPGPPFSPTASLVDAGNCHNCHNPHGTNDGSGSAIQQMLFAKDSKSGDSPAYELGGCEACHDGSQGGATKDVQAQLDKTYAHPTHTYNDRHTLPETGVSEGGTSFGPASTARHAECVDCHNPHTVPSGTTHTAGTTGNAVSDVLKYVWGVEPSWPSKWTQPTTFTVRKPPTYNDGAQYEYQICFKCHSYYGLGTLTNAVSSITGPSGDSITDQAWEFNPNNKSAHPVVVSLNNQTGSDAPKALTSSQMSSPWTSVGTQTMYCSDCHGADDESTGAVGPHGSARKFMLKGTGQYWPYKTDGVTMWRLNTTDAANSDMFCKNCHPIYSGGSWGNNVHSKGDHNNKNFTINGQSGTGVPCVSCHLVVPHGGKRSRLIAYGYNSTSPDVSPYIINTNTAVIRGFKKASSPNTYSKANCYSSYSGCSGDHPNAGGYDP